MLIDRECASTAIRLILRTRLLKQFQKITAAIGEEEEAGATQTRNMREA